MPVSHYRKFLQKNCATWQFCQLRANFMSAQVFLEKTVHHGLSGDEELIPFADFERQIPKFVCIVRPSKKKMEILPLWWHLTNFDISTIFCPEWQSDQNIQLWHFRISVVHPISRAIQPPSSLIWKFTHFSFHGSGNPDPGPEFWLWQKIPNFSSSVLCSADLRKSLPSIIFQTQVRLSNVDLVINK